MNIRKMSRNEPQVYTRSERKSSETCFKHVKSLLTYYITEANQAIDWEGAIVVNRKNNQRQEAMRISQSPHVMNRDRDHTA